jgi:outer membrane protein assembly factor BamE (lipoprotein component of BamABCDE complex)
MMKRFYYINCLQDPVVQTVVDNTDNDPVVQTVAVNTDNDPVVQIVADNTDNDPVADNTDEQMIIEKGQYVTAKYLERCYVGKVLDVR